MDIRDEVKVNDKLTLSAEVQTGDTLRLRGVFRMQCIEKGTGRVLHEFEDNNLVVTTGKTNMVKLLGGDAAGEVVDTIGVGTSNTAAAVGDTALTGAFTKALNTGGTSNVYGANSVRFGYEIETTEANGMTIWEFGLLNTSGILIARKVLSASIAKTSSFGIVGTWTLTVT